MPLLVSLIAALAVLGGLWAPAAAQTSGAYLTPGTVAAAHAEHLVARGVISPSGALERPFLIRSLQAALAAADTTDLPAADRRSLHIVRRAVGLPDLAPPAATGRPSEARSGPGRPARDDGDGWHAALGAGIGAQAATQARRPLLLPGGAGGSWPLAEARFRGAFGPIRVQMTPRLEQRLLDDPDWPVRTRGDDPEIALRWQAALARAEWRWGAVELGELERNWGPPGIPGLIESPRGYHRPGLTVALGPAAFRFQWRTALLDPGTDRDTGAPVERWLSVRRLRWRASPRLEVAVWEAMVTAENNRTDEARFNPFGLYSFGLQFGIGDRRNTTMGTDLMWRVSRGLQLEAQFLVDDVITRDTDANPYPSRWGFTVQGRGALPAAALLPQAGAWRAYVTGLSSLALTTFRPEEGFTDHGVGLGRLRPDHLEAGAEVTAPAVGTALATVGLRWRRQGERRFGDPFPQLEVEPGAPDFPTWSPRIEQETWALHGGLDWGAGPVTLRGSAQLQRRSFPLSGAEPDWHGAARIELLVWLGWLSLRGEA